MKEESKICQADIVLTQAVHFTELDIRFTKKTRRKRNLRKNVSTKGDGERIK